MFDPDAATVFDALKSFMLLLMSNVEDAGLESLVEKELTLSQARVIMTLGKAPEPLPINEVASRLRLSVASAGRNVDQLVKAGLVVRVEDESDRRVKLISLTDLGRAHIDEFIADKHGRAVSLLRQLEPADRVRLLAALTPILARLESSDRTNQER